MPVVSHHLSLNMRGDTQIENVTAQVQDALIASGLKAGLVTIFVQHTTASVFILEDEPGLRLDTKRLWDRLIPADPHWEHNLRNQGENNGHSHLRGQLQGCSLTIPFSDGTLALGTWQAVVIVDFDTRARTRHVVIQIMGE
ncbi:MAG: YjbQ family protein [Nitrospirae bacterium]|nr:MAG: YjbQ family protein [Nitrospirota bacterium]